MTKMLRNESAFSAMQRIMASSVIVLTGLAVSTRASANDQMVFPGETWETATPESQHIDSTKLQSAIQYLQRRAPRDGVKELIVIPRLSPCPAAVTTATEAATWRITARSLSPVHLGRVIASLVRLQGERAGYTVAMRPLLQRLHGSDSPLVKS